MEVASAQPPQSIEAVVVVVKTVVLHHRLCAGSMTVVVQLAGEVERADVVVGTVVVECGRALCCYSVVSDSSQ